MWLVSTSAWHFAPSHQYLTGCQGLEKRKLTSDWGEMEEGVGCGKDGDIIWKVNSKSGNLFNAQHTHKTNCPWSQSNNLNFSLSTSINIVSYFI